MRFHGGPQSAGQGQELADRGVDRTTGPVERGGGTAGRCWTTAACVDAANVVWCTGFRQVFDWIRLPIFDEHGLAGGVPRCRRRGAGAVLLRPVASSTRSPRWSCPGSGGTPHYVAAPDRRPGTAWPSRPQPRCRAIGASRIADRSRRCRDGRVDDLVRAREAFERREWAAVVRGAVRRREPSTLTAEDFARLATAALLVGRRNDCVQALQRAYQLSRDTGARWRRRPLAFWLAMVLSRSAKTR